MMVPAVLDQDIFSYFPESLTIITTYKCNAECEQCCFESNPKLKQRLSLSELIGRIDEAHATFPALKLIVFSGGESFLLKDDLFVAIKHAASLGLHTRCVTNGFWGKSPAVAERTVKKLVEAGIEEINISTGADHQRWVPFESVENAVKALIENEIVTLVTVEKDSEATRCLDRAASSPVIQWALQKYPLLFSLQSNSWMPFNERYEQRGKAIGLSGMSESCPQVLHNLVVTPYDQLAACCGLTFEHIPELKLGNLKESSMMSLFEKALNDFLKIWIHMDGPAGILRSLFGEKIDDDLEGMHHICQACVVLHQHPMVRAVLKERYLEFVPDVVNRFNLKMAIHDRECRSMSRVAAV